jgi:hypothetical protein
MRHYILMPILALTLFACTKEDQNPAASGTSTLRIIAVSDTVEVFPNATVQIEFKIMSGFVENQEPKVHTAAYEGFSINGPLFADQERTRMTADLWGYHITPAPVHINYEIVIGGQACLVPITVRVSDFYLASSFQTNCPGDTIVIPRGGTFLLTFACLDSSHHVVSRARIQRMAWLSYSVYVNSWDNPKFIVSYVTPDSTNFNYLFASLPDITPDNNDNFMNVSFYISNKTLSFPIRIRY